MLAIHHPNTIPFEQTAAGRLTARVPTVPPSATLADIQALFWKSISTFDTVRDVFVVDARGVLVGTVTSRSLFDHPLRTPVTDVMIPVRDVVKVYATDDQETAVQAALAHAVESVAVVDGAGRFKGAISIKELMKILQQETQEDLAAEGRYDMSPKLDSILEIGLWESFKSRAPWILFGVGGGTLVAVVIGYFEGLLADHIVLASFIPLVVYIVGAVSAQLQMLYVRDSAIYPSLPLWRYLSRQSAVVFLIAIALGVVVYGIGLWYPNVDEEHIVLALGTALAATTALVTGVLVPHGLSKIVRDPANATAPVATIVSDTSAILIFFGTAALLLV
ncbi:magnesium transporter [Patescibacteria group bacterium]|nr:magnesium transporter [Patescibacteria group bacterium]